MSKDGLRQLRTEVVRECTLYSGYCAMELARKLTVSADPAFKEEWQEITEAVATEERNDAGQGDTGIPEVEDGVQTNNDDDDNARAEHALEKHTFSASDYGGWRPPPGIWHPIPIGTIEDENDCGT